MNTPPNSPNDAIVKDTIEMSLLPGVGNLALDRIFRALPDISRLYSMDNASLAALGISIEACALIHSRAYRETASEIYDWGVHEGCRFLTRGNPDYPALLNEIFDPPLVLYAQGRMEALDKPCIAVVGTRKPTVYGLQMAQGLAADLGSRGVCVVSGLARGIDGAAHRGCIEGSGLTIAVLGCGIDIVYPREHRQLAKSVVENGLILTEFAPGTSPSPQNFPIRNRIISGLALGTLIVEASEYSGSLITARLAMEQNREVYALPGNLTTPQSFGPNYLIKQGAKLVQSWRDVVEELPPDIRQEMLMREDTRPAQKPGLELLSDEENRILELLKTDETTQFDRIFSSCNLGISQLSDLLLNLEMGGRVRVLPGNLYVKTRK